MIWPGPTASIMMACVDRPRMFLQNNHNHIYGVLTQTTLQILTTVSTSNPIPKIIKEWNVDGYITLGKLNYGRAVYFFTQNLISHTFSTNCVHCFILRLKKTEQTTISNTHTHFTIRTTYDEFQSPTTIKPQGNNFWSWNKTAHMAMKS
jgi:hypothetical protein